MGYLSDSKLAQDKLAETLELIRLQLLQHLAAIAKALEQVRR